jgi:DNA gyrase subunit B
VEGESAGGSAKQARDRRFQAILPLRGKILNVERARLDKILTSKEIRSLIIALGTAVAEDFKIEKARYHRIIIMTDADVDGSHIRTLLLTLFYRHFRPLIEQGYIYIAQPPLYRIQIGKKIDYAYSEEEKDKILGALKKSMPAKAKLGEEKIAGVSLQRYKGLGEMNPDQLWETTMNPEKRMLLRVNVDEAKEADRIFDVLMGDEVLPRKRFIQTHAKKVKNLDV